MTNSTYQSLTPSELTKALLAKDAALETLQMELHKEADKVAHLEAAIQKLKMANPTDDYINQVLTDVDDEEEEKGQPLLTVDELVDMFVTFYDEAKLIMRNKRRNGSKTVASFLTKYDAAYRCAKNKRMNNQSFEYVTTIGHGSFSTIQLVKQKETSKPFVIKKMTKADATSQTTSLFWTTELEILKEAGRCQSYDGRRAPGIAALRYAFHDATNLYFVLDYYPGGDLLSLLGKHENFREEMARFYMAEMAIVISTVHRMGYIHRDIKIENFLLDAKGHVYLTDFGSAVKMSNGGTSMAYMTGGTAEYISPELVKIMQGDSVQYGPGVDWWSLGIILFEMLTGETPFYDDSVLQVYHKIENYQKCLCFDGYEGITVSADAQDLVRGMIQEQSSRLGAGGVAEIMNHRWFNGTDWDQVRGATKVPFKPNLVGKFDTTFFDDCEVECEEAEPTFKRKSTILSRKPSQMGGGDAVFGELLPYVGFAYCYTGTNEERQEGTPFIEDEVRSRYKKRKASQEGKGLMSNLSGGLSSEDLLLTPNSSSISPPKIPAKPNTQCPNPNSIPESSPPCTSTTEPLSGPGIPSAANSGTTPTPLLAARPKRGSLLNINTIPNEQRTSTKPRVRWDNQVVLFHAASTGDLDEVKEQVKTAGLDSTNELNMHAMHYAVYGGQLEVIKFMVESGATLDTKNTDGNTPLYLALIEEEDAIALYFMAKGSDLHYENCGGCSAYDLAESKVMKAAISEMDKASRRNSGAKTDPAPEKEDGGLTSSLRRTPLIPVTQTAGVM